MPAHVTACNDEEGGKGLEGGEGGPQHALYYLNHLLVVLGCCCCLPSAFLLLLLLFSGHQPVLEKLLRAGLDVDAPILPPKPPWCNGPGCSTSGCKGGTGCSGLTLVADASLGLLLDPPATVDSSNSSSGGGGAGSNKGGMGSSRVSGLPGTRWVVAEDKESCVAGG